MAATATLLPEDLTQSNSVLSTGKVSSARHRRRVTTKKSGAEKLLDQDKKDNGLELNAIRSSESLRNWSGVNTDFLKSTQDHEVEGVILPTVNSDAG